MLQKIESHLKPDAEQMLKQLEENPELYDEISDKLLAKMNEDLEELEEAIENDQEVDDEIKVEGETEPIEGQDIGVKENDESSVNIDHIESEEPIEDESIVSDMPPEDQADVLRDMGAREEVLDEEATELFEVEPSEDLAQPAEVMENGLEPDFAPEQVIEAIEAEDLSPLEAELYPELEALEVEEQTEAERY